MVIESFLLCDAATDQQGKLNMLGVYDHIQSRKLPVVQPSCSLVLRIRFAHHEEGSHDFKITFADMDGNLVMQALKCKVNVQMPKDSDTTTNNFIFNLQGLELKKFGEYSIDLIINEEHMSSLPLFVKEIKE